MKKQINPTIKAHLIRSAFYLLLLLAICAIPFALAQRQAARRTVANPAKPNASDKRFPTGPPVTQLFSGQAQSPKLGPKDLLPAPAPAAPELPAANGLPTGPGYTFTMMSGCAGFVPGTTDIGNHCDDCSTVITLPFSYTLYDQTFNSVQAGSNGHLTFGTVNNTFNPSCMPVATATYAVGPYWTDQCTGACFNVTCSSCGIFTSSSGTAPNRIFNIEYRTAYYNSGGDGVPLNYEVRLYEGQTYFDVIYETINTFMPPSARNLVVGVQRDSTNFTQEGCDPTGGQNPPVATCTTYRYTLAGATPTPTPTCTPTNVIVNGDFETGSFPPWIVDNSNPAPFVASSPTYPVHSGTFSGHVGSLPGGETPGDSSFYQQFTVPAGGGTLSFWYWTRTVDSISFDWQDAYITNTSGTILQTIFHQCTNNQAWMQQTVNMAAYAGMTVRIKFLAHGDNAGDPTDMFVDDAQLLLPCGSTPTPTPTPTCNPLGSYRVLVLSADCSNPEANLIAALQAEPGIAAVTLFDGTTGTPTLAQLQQYDIVFAFSNCGWLDATTVGNNLDAYIAGGGIVVAANFDWFGGTQSIGGAWATNDSPFNNNATTNFSTGALQTCTFAPLCNGVTTLQSFFREITTLAAGATGAGTWDDGSLMMAYKGRTVGISGYFGDLSGMYSGQIGRIVANAGRWLAPPACGTPTPTPTATVTASATPTATATFTPTPTIAPTATPTATASATATPTPTATGTPLTCNNYIFSTSTGNTIVPGTTDTGNHTDDGTTPITLPFSVQFYDQSYTAANVDSNGTLQFVSNISVFTNSCLPATSFNFPMFPHWDDLRTDAQPGCSAYPGGTCGIYTSTTGTAPNRTFNIEYRTVYFANGGADRANFEVQLHEGTNQIDFVYGTVANSGSSATVGVQRDTGSAFTQFECNTGGITSGLGITFTCAGAPSPTPTPTCTPSWSLGPNMPSPAVRSVGVFFPANGKFYAMGGRSSEAPGSDFMHPFEYDPATNAWTTKAATYPDNQVNNMACGILTDAGTPYIYCVGGSAAGAATSTDRVFRYNPATDTISAVAAPWPGALGGTTLPGGFSTFNNKLYILGGFTISPAAAVDTIWEFTPGTNTWVQKSAVLPAARAYIPTTTIGSFIYTGGGTAVQSGLLVDAADSFRYDPMADSIITIASIPRATGETRALTFNGQMWVMGGGRTAPNPSNEVDVYDPGTNTWSLGLPFMTARRNFPTDTNGSDRIWLAGGYDSTNLPLASMEIFGCPSATPTPTATFTPTPTATATSTPTATATPTIIPSATPTSTPTATPTPTVGTPTPTPTCGGPPVWQSGPDQPPARYAIQAALGTDNMLYIAGGQTADPVPTVYNQVSRYNYTTNTWSNVAPLPVALGQGAIGAWNGKIYVAGGFIGGTSVTNALRIYDIATNTWTSGASMPTTPGVEAAAGAVVNGKFYVMGGDDFNNGLNTNFIYDIATDTWTTGATLPDSRTNTYGTAYNGMIYVYGGVILPAFMTTDTLLRYDPVANSWTNLGSAGTAGLGNYGGISPLGTGQLLITDGADSTGASTTATHIFTISGGTFSAGPAMIGNRAGHAQGTLPDGRVLVADGFNTASTTVSTVELLTAPCPSATPTPTATFTPTPTATATATFTPTATATATATFTPTATATATATAIATATATPTATATLTPRPTPTPRPKPTPAPRPNP